MILLSVATLDPARVAAMRNSSLSAADMANLVPLAASNYRAAVLQTGIYWFKGNLAMATGRGYPITGAWGPGDPTLAPWIYFGGDFPNSAPPGTAPRFWFSGGVKSTGLTAAIAAHFGFQIDPSIIMAGAVSQPRLVKSGFATNFQSSWVTDTYAHYSEAGRLWQPPSWRARAVFLFNITGRMWFNPVTFAVNPFIYEEVVDPVALNTSHLYGSMSYGTSHQENFLQDRSVGGLGGLVGAGREPALTACTPPRPAWCVFHQKARVSAGGCPAAAAAGMPSSR